VDANSQEIVAMSLTDNSIDDASAAKAMLILYPFYLLSLQGDISFCSEKY
jgi:hypothetical protein